MRSLFVLLTIAALAAVVTEAQAPQNPTFRSGTDVVRIDVSVLDKNRVPVRGLTTADFTVREEGKPRPVVASASSLCRPPRRNRRQDGVVNRTGRARSLRTSPRTSWIRRACS